MQSSVFLCQWGLLRIFYLASERLNVCAFIIGLRDNSLKIGVVESHLLKLFVITTSNQYRNEVLCNRLLSKMLRIYY